MSKHRWDHETCQICGLMRSGSRVTGGLTYHTPDGRASLRAGPCSRWVPEVGDSVRRSDTDMSGEVTKVTKTSSLISDGASTHHVRVRWASGSESTVSNARLVPA